MQEYAMNARNYVQEAWEERFQIHRQPRSGNRFALGFLLGAAMTGGILLWLGATAAASSLL